MRNHSDVSKVVYSVVTLCLLASLAVLGCSPQATPSPTPTTTKPATPTATATAKPTPTPTTAPSSQPQYGGTLKIAIANEANTLGYPAIAASSMVTVLEAGPAAEPLLRLDDATNLLPQLASAFKTDAAAKTVTLSLRKGVKFHDGTDFNATAVKWNLDQLVTAKAAAASLFKSVDVVDDYTVRINLTDWSSTVTPNFAQAPGLMLSPTAFQTNGMDWATKHPIGTGPFKFVAWNPSATISYNRFDGYWQQGKPYLDGVQIILLKDDITRQLSLEAGEIHSAYALISTNLPKLKASGFTVVTRPASVGAQAYVPDAANPKSPFADVRVRQAAAYAIDNQALVKSIYSEYGAVVTNQLSYPGFWAYNSSVVGYPYDPAKAKQLLTAAGYPNGFQTKMMTNTNQSSSITYSTGVQSYLKAVGIDATLDSYTSSALDALRVSGMAWQGLAWAKFAANPDWVYVMNSTYNGHGSYVNMLLPDDYSQAINNAFLAADDASKQRYAQEAMKLAVDKYALMIPEYSQLDSVTSWAYVHNSGLYAAAVGWTPEAAWLGKP